MTAEITTELQKKIDASIERMRYAAGLSKRLYGTPLALMYSGGKDSAVIAQLALEGLEKGSFEVWYKSTTADAPENVYHIRSEFKKFESAGVKTHIVKPPYSMWELIEKYGAPSRQYRFCCYYLKERNLKETPYVCTGVRWEESANRRDRSVHSTRNHSQDIMLTNDNADTRRVFETCNLKSARVCNPIVDWTASDVFLYLLNRGVTINPLYLYFNRVGCIGCPLATEKARRFDFAMYPKLRAAWARAFEKNIARRQKEGDTGSAKMVERGYWQTAEDVFEWSFNPDDFWRKRGGRPRGVGIAEKSAESI